MKSSLVNDCGGSRKLSSRSPRPLPPIAYLRSVFSYDPAIGQLRTKKGNIVEGFPNGANRPYRRVNIAGKAFLYHRICYALFMGYDPYPLEIDHIDRDGTNNRPTNLRAVRKIENQRNRIVQYSNGTRGYAGKRYPFFSVKVGESFHVMEPDREGSIRARASQVRKRHGMRFRVNKFGGGIRVCRIA